MRHLKEASDAMNNKYIKVANQAVVFTIQDGPIKEVGENGCQAQDMLEFTKNLFESLNRAYPCRENAITITKIEEALHWQDARTKDREARKVEGTNAD